MNCERNDDNLEENIREILDSIHVCRRCRMCVDMCPTHEGWLTESSMGRLAAIYMHFKYGIGDEEELSQILYSCASCRRCEERCKMVSVGVSPAEIIIEARQVLVCRAQIREREQS